MSVKRQYGVIPYTKKKNASRILLVTSRANGYWIFPKGNPIKKKDIFQSAQQEAFEEAGVLGDIDKKFSYKIKFRHQSVDHEIILFPMKIGKIFKEWPEKKQRKRKFVSIDKALDLIKLTSLQNCLKQWKRDFRAS